MVHPLNRSAVRDILNATVLEATAQKRAVHCHLRCTGSTYYKYFEIRVSYGTQGLVCTATEVLESVRSVDFL